MITVFDKVVVIGSGGLDSFVAEARERKWVPMRTYSFWFQCDILGMVVTYDGFKYVVEGVEMQGEEESLVLVREGDFLLPTTDAVFAPSRKCKLVDST